MQEAEPGLHPAGCRVTMRLARGGGGQGEEAGVSDWSAHRTGGGRGYQPPLPAVVDYTDEEKCGYVPEQIQRRRLVVGV